MNTYCGSRLAVDYDLYKAKVAELTNLVERKISDNKINIAERHNLFTSYTVLNLMSCSGHRPVSDPFCFLKDFDLEDRFVIINDKVLSPAYANRISWLSETATSQIQEYIKHLNTLVEYSRDEYTENVILESLDKDTKRTSQKIPFLFFLKDDLSGIVNITKSSLEDILKNIWPYRWNIFRHILESKLYEESIEIDAINAHLSHHNNHQHPFGNKTSWTANECGERLKTALNKLSKEQGWKSISGINHHTDTKETIRLNAIGKFGHLKRKYNLKTHKIKIDHKINDILQEYFSDDQSIKEILTNKNAQITIQNEIISRCPESKRILNYTLKAFDHILREEAFNQNTPFIRANKPFADEISPFSENWIDLFKSCKKVRCDFITILKTRDYNDINSSPEYLWAEICVSAILFDGLCQQGWIEDVINEGPKRFCKLKKWNVFYDIYIDRHKKSGIDNTSSPDWRWQPGSFSKGLVYGMLDKFGNTSSIALKPSITKKHINNLLKRASLIPKLNNETPPLNQILKITQAFWKYHIPNLFNQVLSGQHQTTPLPKSTYARLIRKRRVETLIKNDTGKPKMDPYLPYNDNIEKKYDINLFKKNISDIFKGAETIYGNHKQKIFIIDKIERLFISNTCFPRVTLYLGKWLIHLCNRKTKKGKHLELSTITTHYYRISSALLNLIRTDDIRDYDTENIEHLYYKIVTFKYKTEKDLETHAENCKLRAIQLAQFDTFLQNQFGLKSEDVDWRYVAGTWAEYLDKRVDANLITPTEYLHIIEFIFNHKGFKDYQRIWIGAYIVFGFRFGLRISEVRRLTIEDIQRRKSQFVTQVISSKLGKTKSLAGIRQVPLIGKLSQKETYFIDEIISRAKSNPTNDLRTPLFTDPSNNHKLIERSLIWQSIHPILRHITGCPTVRFHSLRHGFANGLFSILFQKHGYKLIDTELDTLWRDTDQSLSRLLLNDATFSIESQRLTALTTIIGHADSSTTLNSYIHILDDIISGYTEKASHFNITIKELSRVVNISESLLERRRRNCHAPVNDGYTTLQSIQLDEKIESYTIKRTNWPLTLPEYSSTQTITLKLIDQIFEWYGQRDRNHHRLNIIFDIDQHDIIKLINIGKKIEKDSSFYHYGLGGQLINTWLEPDIFPETNKKNFGFSSYSRLLDKAETLFTSVKNKNSLLESANTWKTINNTSEDRHAYILDGPDSLNSFITGLYLLGFSNTDLMISIPSDLTKKQHLIVRNKISNYNIDISTKHGKIRKLNRNIGDLRKDRVRLSLKRNQNKNVQYNQTLSRVFFLALIFHEFTTSQ